MLHLLDVAFNYNDIVMKILKTKNNTWRSIQESGNKVSLNVFGEKQKIITASQARENVRKVGGCLKAALNDILSQIEILSNMGYTMCCYSLNQTKDQKIEQKIVTKLKKLGYNIELDDYGFLHISW
jgi:SAM-dependent MidA family methyltransferase